MSTNFAKTLVWKQDYDVTNSAHQIQMITLCHWMNPPPWKVSAYATGSLCNCTVCKCQKFALNKAPVLLTTLNSMLLYIVGDRRDLCLQNRWKFCHTLSF